MVLRLLTDHPSGSFMTEAVPSGKNRIGKTRRVLSRILAVLKEKRPYELRDLDGKVITKEQARELVATLHGPEVVRERARNKKTTAAPVS